MRNRKGFIVRWGERVFAKGFKVQMFKRILVFSSETLSTLPDTLKSIQSIQSNREKPFDALIFISSFSKLIYNQ